MFTPRIVISGAGPGGLSLARLLRLRGIEAQLLDLRNRPTAAELARPSGMLDLHENTGLATIKACGLEQQFRSALDDCSEATRVRTPSGRLVWSDEGEGSNRPEIPRASLVDMLVRSLPESAIRWNTKVSAVRTEQLRAGQTEVVITHGNGNETTADLVIGADGAWSKTRKLLTQIKPVYTGLQYITVTARHITDKHPHVLDTIGSGASFALGNGHGIMTHRGPQDSMRVYIAVKTSDERWADARGLTGQSAIKAKEVVLGDGALFRDWAPALKELISIACDEDARDGFNPSVDIRGIYTLPRTDAWESVPGVTVIGDAAHLMAPNGEGVNNAMADARDLATAIADVGPQEDAAAWQRAISPQIRKYEAMMHARARQAFDDTDELLEIMHGGNNGAEALADMFRGFGLAPTDGVRGTEELSKV